MADFAIPGGASASPAGSGNAKAAPGTFILDPVNGTPVSVSAFTPQGSSSNPPTCSAKIAVTTAVQQINLPSAVAQNGGSLRLCVDGAANIAWCLGANAALTIDNGVFMFGNTSESFGVPAGTAQLSVIGTATGSNFRVHVGEGQ